MKNFLHHLNQALYDTNHSFWQLVRPGVIAIIFGISLLIATFVPIVLVGKDWFMYPWAIFTILAGSYGYISFLIFDRSQHQEQPQEEILLESDNGLTIVKEATAVEPLTIRESLYKGLHWTKYVFAIVIGSVVLSAVIAVMREPVTPIVAVCPSDYPNTEEGIVVYQQATDDWVKRYLEANPFTSEEELIVARNESWADTCPETLEEYNQLEEGDVSTSSYREFFETR